MAVDRFERLFRETASLDADKSNLRRMNELVNRKLRALLLAGQGRAQAEGRDVIEAGDVPVTAGLQHCIQTFRDLDERLDVQARPEEDKVEPADWGRIDEILQVVL